MAAALSLVLMIILRLLRLSSLLLLSSELVQSDYRRLASLSAVLPADDFEDDSFTAVLSEAAFLDEFPEDPFVAVLVEAPFVDDDTFADNASGAEPSLAEV